MTTLTLRSPLYLVTMASLRLFSQSALPNLFMDTSGFFMQSSY